MFGFNQQQTEFFVKLMDDIGLKDHDAWREIALTYKFDKKGNFVSTIPFGNSNSREEISNEKW
ncbi:hypothetical protein FACS1894200_02180 [Spirochaetia bacterium]|nr:hypothetical protein FACS1894200_02180 [Spirochaetia bacterium]